MKTRLLALAMLLCALAAKAQYVTIPDPAFALFLQQGYPNCMNGNQMDTTCWEITTAWDLYCSGGGISDLDGVQYFDSLRYLECSHNSLTTLGQLPKHVNEIYCNNNLINALPTQLPDSLLILFCDSNLLSSLPVLPSSLHNLHCELNQLSSLPTLPQTLQELWCSYNPITTLPTLPDSLKNITCYGASLTSLPLLPAYLQEIEVSYNQISAIPALPSTLHTLSCESNLLQSLPALPASLKTLNFGGNTVPAYPILPTGLKSINCSFNPITSLAGLPQGLEDLNCDNIQVNVLPSLPPTLKNLGCGNNSLQNLPTLPNTLVYLSCYSNQLTALPPLPSSIFFLRCLGNPLIQIQSLPSLKYLYAHNCPNLTDIGELSDTIVAIDVSSCSNLRCLPKFKRIAALNFSNTSITCLPVSFTVTNSCLPALSGFPICDQFNNTNGCPIYASISGQTYTDRNNNCAFDSIDEGQFGLKHSLYSNGVLLKHTYSNNTGNYSFDETGLSNYETRLDTTGLPFTVACPTGGVYYDTLTTNDSTHFNRDFALQCETGFDLAAQSVASAMVFRPANNTVVDVHAGDLANFYSANCAQGVSGTVTVKLHGPISYIAPAANAIAPSNVSNNVLTWNVADFGTANALTDFNIIIQTDTFAQIGQQACFEVNVTPLAGDNDTSNNDLYYCFNIVNSYDPNDKTAYPSGNIDTTQEWLTYRVRFQNTGNAEAQHIYIMDTLDANVKVETFQLLSYSHQPNVQIKENIVRFNFPFINLPDSFSNEPGSHGYVQYKVKLKDDLPIGTTINNTAYIYFDFNPPVVTNTATNTIAVEEDTVEVGIRSISKSFDLLVYPNPANQQVTVTTNTPSRTVSILDAWGRVRLTQAMNGTSATINIADLPSGVYFVSTGSNTRKKVSKTIIHYLLSAGCM